MSPDLPKYGRVLLKVSGETLAGEKKFGLCPETLQVIAREISGPLALQVEMGVVVGGGNIFRGLAAAAMGLERTVADYMGMLATVINALALQDALEKEGIPTRVLSAIAMHEVAEPYIRRRALRHLEKKRVVIFAAGTGSPYFTTDTAAALRAMELKTEALLKATRVDGVYDADPLKDPKAKRFKRLTYMDVLKRDLKVMDATAVSLCMDSSLPILVFKLADAGNMLKAIMGEDIGTVVGDMPASSGR